MKYLRLIVFTAVAAIILLVAFRSADTDQPVVQSKINGVSFVAPPRTVTAEALTPIKKINADWIAITPYAFSRKGGPEIRYNLSRQWRGERNEGVVETITQAKKLSLNVMLKPHVWVRGQGWAGEFELESEADWQKWERNYRDYIISYAKVADSLDVALYCIGTEYRKATVHRPDFWHNLIADVRKIYDGNLTYAANWDNYKNIAFWRDLDYIGVDAYFPISEQMSPSVSHLKQQWKPVVNELQSYARQQAKPVLFAEYGYRSIDFTADGHWKYEGNERGLNMQAQANAYRALFETFWDEPWFAGGFLWKWFDRHPESGGRSDMRYTPQNKPAEKVIHDRYGSK